MLLSFRQNCLMIHALWQGSKVLSTILQTSLEHSLLRCECDRAANEKATMAQISLACSPSSVGPSSDLLLMQQERLLAQRTVWMVDLWSCSFLIGQLSYTVVIRHSMTSVCILLFLTGACGSCGHIKLLLSPVDA